MIRFRLAILLIGIAAAVAVAIRWPLATRGALPPILTIADSDLRLGTVLSTDRHECVLRINNPSDRTIAVAKLEASCKCTKLEPETFTVGAGETQEVRLVIDLSARTPEEAVPLRDFRVDLMARPSENHESPSRWRIEGQVKTLLAFDPPLVDLGEVPVGVVPGPRTIECATSGGVEQIDAACTLEGARVDVAPIPGTDNRFRLTLVPSKALQLGDINAAVSARPVVVGSKASMPHQKLSIVGTVVPTISAVPRALAFGRVTVGETAEGTISLASRTGGMFLVTEAWAEGQRELKVEPLPDPAASPPDANLSRRDFRVTLTPSAKGRRTGAIRFEIAASGEMPAETITVPTGWYGVAEDTKLQVRGKTPANRRD